MKFIGHLDVMRYFQKAIRRADIDIAYTAPKLISMNCF